MKLIESNAELILESNPYKKVELIGRTCYKSEDKVTENSYVKFVMNLIDREHFAMLEHGTITYCIEGLTELPISLYDIPYLIIDEIFDPVVNAKRYLVTVSLSHLHDNKITFLEYDRLAEAIWCEFYSISIKTYIGIDNLTDFDKKVISELPSTQELGINITIVEDVKQFPGITQKIADRHIFTSIKFLCDRGVSHELVRHRCAAAQESTRYCNYTKEKFGGGDIKFIYPAGYENWTNEQKSAFEQICKCSEKYYNIMMSLGMQPQQSRAALTNALKTEVILTMSIARWKHFFNLRSKGTTGAPHPDMKIVADKAYKLFADYTFDDEYNHMRLD